MKLSHLNENGDLQMVDILGKTVSKRVATASACVYFPTEVYTQIITQNGQTAKGSIAEVARLAGIMAAKKTADLIPLCHPMMLEKCDIECRYDDSGSLLYIEATTAITHKTGVEMEALTAVSVAALTVYDMTKAMSHDIRIGEIQLLHKSGGKREFQR